MPKFSNTSKQPFIQKSWLPDLDFSLHNGDPTMWMFWIFGGKRIFVTRSPFVIQTWHFFPYDLTSAELKIVYFIYKSFFCFFVFMFCCGAYMSHQALWNLSFIYIFFIKLVVLWKWFIYSVFIFLEKCL